MLLLTLPFTANTQESKPVLSELSRLKADNFKLKVQLTQCNVSLNDRNAKIASSDLTAEQQKLVIEFKKELGITDEEVAFNWDTLTFSPIVK